MNLLLILSGATSASSSEGGASGASSMESLKKIFTNPILYIVLGALVLLILAVYLFRRMVKARPNAVTIIVRRGQIHKVLDEKTPKYFMVPFLDSVGAIITEGDKELSSDHLYINNGPDALYKVNYTLKYRILDPVAFYPCTNTINEALPSKLNDALRLYADEGNALVIVKDYRAKAEELLKVINEATKDFHIEVIEFKINLIEPMGGR